MTDYTRTVEAAGRTFRLAPLNEEQLFDIFVLPEESMTVWEQHQRAIYCSLANAGLAADEIRLDGLTANDLYRLLAAIARIHGGIPAIDLMESRTRPLIAEASRHIH